MKIKLTAYDGTVREANIATTKLTAPSVIAWNGKFFALNTFHAKITNDNTLLYRQCGGESLNNIELVEVPNDDL
ncbi:MAG: hypothetical protein ACBR12_14345 [Microcoleus sp.]